MRDRRGNGGGGESVGINRFSYEIDMNVQVLVELSTERGNQKCRD